MRVLLLFLQIYFFVSTSFAFELYGIGNSPVTDVGNGGDLVICEDEQGKVVKKELLDLYEGRVVQNLQKYEWPSGKDEYEIARKILNRFKRVSFYRWERLKNWLNDFEKEITLVSGLYDKPDSDHQFLEEGCKVRQLALHEEPQTPFETWYKIEEELWVELDIYNRAALILHELLFREAFYNYEHKNSRSIRKVNAIMVADKFKELTDQQIYETLVKLHFPQYEFDRILFEVDETQGFLPSFGPKGSIQEVACRIVDGESSCQLATTSPLQDIFGFSEKHYLEGLESLRPFSEHEKYKIHFGKTGLAKNVSFLKNNRDIQFSIKTIDLKISTLINRAQFLQYDDEGRPLRFKANAEFFDDQGQNFYRLDVEDKWRKRIDVKFFHRNNATFIGLAGGHLKWRGNEYGLCGLPEDFNGSYDIGDYPTLLLVDENGWDVVNLCEGNPYSIGLLKFEMGANDLDFGEVAIQTHKQVHLILKNDGEGEVSQLDAFVEKPFSFTGGQFPGTNGTCKDVLGSQESCSLDLSFSPLTKGQYKRILSLSYYNGIDTTSLNKTLQGEAVDLPELIISGIDPMDFGTAAVGSYVSQILKLTNRGSHRIEELKVMGGVSGPFHFSGEGYPGTAGTCGKSLDAGASCSLEIRFAPTSEGFTSDYLWIFYNNGAYTDNVGRALQGLGMMPALLTISEMDPYDFGTVVVGSSTTIAFTITNMGSSLASAMREVGLAAPFHSGSSIGGDCGETLAPGASCYIEVKFAPTGTGVANDTIDIAYFDGVSSVNSIRDMMGTGVAPAALLISDGPVFDYGTVASGSSSPHHFKIMNVGGDAAAGMRASLKGSPFHFAGGVYPGTGGTCTTTLPAAGSCTIAVEFSPAIVGAHNDKIELSYRDGAANQQVNRDIVGQAVTPASLTITEYDPYDFGVVAVGGGDSTHIFTITNTGSYEASHISEVGLAMPFAFSGGSYPGLRGDCGSRLPGAATCRIEVEFSPASTGMAVDTIDISYFDGVTSVNSTRDVQGTGVSPALITITGTNPVDFGTVTVGSSATHTFTITNTGSSSALNMREIGLTIPFRFVGGSYPGVGGNCGVTLAPGASCDLEIEFAPKDLGFFSDTIKVFYYDGTRTVHSTRDVQGHGIDPRDDLVTQFFNGRGL